VYAIVCESCHGMICTPTPGQCTDYRGHITVSTSASDRTPPEDGPDAEHYHPHCWEERDRDSTPPPHRSVLIQHTTSVPWE
jgi:hypothetical protein